MTRVPDYSLPSRDQLVGIIQLQNQIALQRLDLSQVMDLIVETAVQLLLADGAAIELLEGEDLVYRAITGGTEDLLGLRLETFSSLSGLCVRTGKTQICNDSEADDRVNREACRLLGLRSMLIIPLQYNDESIGALKVMSKRPSAFSSTHKAVLEMLADVLGAEIQFANTYSDDSLYYLATHDQMTGLYNRSMFYDRLRNDIKRHEREGVEFGVMMLDMDGLKVINDTYGHRAGDAAIIEMARRISTTIRKSDTAARLGGDEFGVILQPTHGLAFLDDLVERIRSAVTKSFEFDQHSIELDISIGTSISSESRTTLDLLIEQADKAMYENKRAHKEMKGLGTQ